MGARRKIVHIITRMDRGGSAQNTLLTCQELSRKHDVVLAYGLSLESKMTALERQSVERQIAEARKDGLRDIRIPALVRRIDPVRDIRAFFCLWALLRREKPAIAHTHTQKVNFSHADHRLRSKERHIYLSRGSPAEETELLHVTTPFSTRLPLRSVRAVNS